MDWSGKVYLSTGSTDLILILGCMTSNFFYLSFTTLYSSSLWRTDTIVVSQLNTPPLSNKPPRGLNRGLTVYKETGLNFLLHYIHTFFFCESFFSLLFLSSLETCVLEAKSAYSFVYPFICIMYWSWCAHRHWSKQRLWSKIAAHECRQRFDPTTFCNF